MTVYHQNRCCRNLRLLFWLFFGRFWIYFFHLGRILPTHQFFPSYLSFYSCTLHILFSFRMSNVAGFTTPETQLFVYTPLKSLTLKKRSLGGPIWHFSIPGNLPADGLCNIFPFHTFESYSSQAGSRWNIKWQRTLASKSLMTTSAKWVM